VDRAENLHKALAAAEEALGNAVERYRVALGCCTECGDFFESGELGVAIIDEVGRIGFEHESCPADSTDYGSSYRNARHIRLHPPPEV